MVIFNSYVSLPEGNCGILCFLRFMDVYQRVTADGCYQKWRRSTPPRICHSVPFFDSEKQKKSERGTVGM